jgi:nucleotide-binding universal stress UspA family protein
MQNLSSILLLVERGDQGHHALNKALLLARHLHARLELFLCDTERYSFARSGSDEAADTSLTARVAEGREYLRALRKAMLVTDIDVSSDAVCHVSLRAALADKLRHGGVDLVVKAVAAAGDGHSHGAIDWPLVASCSVPLLLTRGRPWHPVPRFAAAVDLQDRQGRALSSAITAIGESLSRSCGAELEILFAQAGSGAEFAPERLTTTLNAIARAHRLDVRSLQYLNGEPTDVLPGIVAQRDYDLVVMGKPQHGWPPELSRSVAARVVRASRGDVLFTAADGETTGVTARGRALGASTGLRRGRRREP